MGPTASRPAEGEEGERPHMFHRPQPPPPPLSSNSDSVSAPKTSNDTSATEEEIIPTPPPLPPPSTRRHFALPFASHDEALVMPPSSHRRRARTVVSSENRSDKSASSDGGDRSRGRNRTDSITGAVSTSALDKRDSSSASAIHRHESATAGKFKDTNKVREGVDEEGNKLINQYSMICKLGKGAYGKVKLAMDIRTNQPYAIKIMSKSQLQRMRKNNGENAMDDVRKEVAIMKKLSHKNVVRLYEVINDPRTDKIYLVLEYLPNGPITKVLSNGSTNTTVSEETARGFLRDALSGLAYLHAQGIIHRDIKPENLLVDSDNCVKITDFGVSQFTNGNDDVVDFMAGTPAFLAPEAITQERFAGKPCDIWALGVSLYSLIFGCIPFLSDNYAQMYEMIKTEELQFPKPLSTSLRDLFSKILEKDPQKRITLPEIQQHPWVNADGELPIEVPTFERLHVTDEDVSNAITKIKFVDRVALMVKLKSRMGKKAEEARSRSRSLHKTQPPPSGSSIEGTTPTPLDTNTPDASTFSLSLPDTPTPLSVSAGSSPNPPSPISASSWSESTPTSPQSR